MEAPPAGAWERRGEGGEQSRMEVDGQQGAERWERDPEQDQCGWNTQIRPSLAGTCDGRVMERVGPRAGLRSGPLGALPPARSLLPLLPNPWPRRCGGGETQV